MIRLIGRNTVEEIMLARAEAKLKLTSHVIGSDVTTSKNSVDLVLRDNSKVRFQKSLF